MTCGWGSLSFYKTVAWYFEGVYQGAEPILVWKFQGNSSNSDHNQAESGFDVKLQSIAQVSYLKNHQIKLTDSFFEYNRFRTLAIFSVFGYCSLSYSLHLDNDSNRLHPSTHKSYRLR